MSGFIETVRKSDQYELCGRMIREDGDLVIFIDGVGRFSLPSGLVTSIVLGLGDGEITGQIPGTARLSESGRGFYLKIAGESYVTPVARVRAVMSGENRKAPVSRVR